MGGQSMSEERETHTTTPALDLDAIEARANAATPGPWEKCGANDGRCACGMINTPLPPNGVDPFMFAYRAIDGVATIPMRDEDYRNIDFIAAARTDVPALVAEVRNLRAYVAALDNEIKAFYGEPINTAQRSPEATTAVLVQELEECVSAFCASKVLNRAVSSAANEMQCARARLLRRGWALESENAKLHTDLERIGRERDDMARANAELQPLASIANEVIAYRRRVGPLGFQLEKLDDYLSKAGLPLDAPNNEHAHK
jgi:hypothetical protein